MTKIKVLVAGDVILSAAFIAMYFYEHEIADLFIALTLAVLAFTIKDYRG